ncbi:monocarboxylate transporter 6-like [Colletes gigas]|uniref:monocarboxylate transporter 6-like n=1 Tax=Colletes gigas TaxID=935657 RepID=UPI001C9B4CF6|nr:monocarboxylate transporter 6-like [Colletes gigas]XP_043260794.1 monocarboxylate transporter 6-like [Colletes gigas]XP_043260796.1 monocarboxylate transporter 6-like [Colletes gigas]
MSRDEADRGWAWVVVAAVTIINLAVLPIQQCYGLIFSERFLSLGISATQTSFILHLNGTIACSLGLISGPMMKRFTFRKVAFLGGLTVAVGICMTAFAVAVPAIIVTYCIIVGTGHGITFLAINLALNTYFRKKRNVAMGLSVTLTGLGPILMPFLIAKLLESYATTGTLLILAGIAMHSLIGASLLRPFKEKEIASLTKGNDITESSAEKHSGDVNSRLLNEDVARETINNDKKGEKRKFLLKISEHLDLDLFRDTRYVAVILGMGVSLVAETNFNAMIPFVLAELCGLERTSIATVMSIQAASDIFGRLCVPLVAQKAEWTSKNLYVVSLIGSTLGRTILTTWGSSYVSVVCVALIIGVAKGTKAVFQTLIISDYVPLNKLPAAFGMQMACSGVLSIAIGPIIGLVHDSMNSYVAALHFTSILSLSCIFMWYVSGFLRYNKDTGKSSEKTEKKDTEKREETIDSNA